MAATRARAGAKLRTGESGIRVGPAPGGEWCKHSGACTRVRGAHVPPRLPRGRGRPPGPRGVPRRLPRRGAAMAGRRCDRNSSCSSTSCFKHCVSPGGCLTKSQASRLRGNKRCPHGQKFISVYDVCAKEILKKETGILLSCLPSKTQMIP